MSEASDRGEKPRKPAGPPGRGAAGGRRPTGSPQGSGSSKPPRAGSSDRPKRDGDSKPKRDGDYPKRDATDRPKRDYPKRDSTDRPKRDYSKSDGDARPKRTYDKRDGDGPARPKREYGKPGAGKPSGGSRDATDRPKREYTKRDGDARPPRSGSGAPRTGAGAPRSGAPRTGGPRTGAGAPYRAGGTGRPQSAGGPPRPPHDPDRIRPPRAGEGSDRPRQDDPIVAEDVQARDLDRGARAELKTLTKENADFVAEHLVMAGRLIETDPVTAHRHALAAARRGGRIGVVREAVGITAYATGDFALALRELRTYRRITGRNDQLPLMVDSERGVGRPAAALELGRSVPRDKLEVSVQVALAIAMSGARLDLEQPEAALAELQISQLDPERAFSWSPALFDAYATVLEDLGHTEEAEQWWQRSDRATIALERADLPEGEDTVEIIEEEFDLDEAEPDAAAESDDNAQPDADAPAHG